MIRIVILSLAFLLISGTTFSQVDGLKSGPMVGYCEMREVMIWLQTEESADVLIEYFPMQNQEQVEKTKTISTTEKNGGVANFEIGDLEPGETYVYAIHKNGIALKSEETLTFSTQSLWQFREDPRDFKVALGSCAYVNEAKYDRPGKSYGSNYGIFESITEKDPDMMLWLGDNVYFREADWNSQSGMLHRYTHTRSLPEMQSLLSHCPNYATWDDHDFGPNDSNGSFVHKEISLELFKLFWGDHGFAFPNEGVTQQFQFVDMDFFLLDNRWWRTHHGLAEGERQMLGKKQIDWLILSLKTSKTPFKFVAVGGQVLNDHAIYENYSQFEEEREELLRRIDENNIQNVVFLTGDRHHTELSKLEMENVTIYDLTCSPLTSHFYDFEGEQNSLTVDGTQVAEHNFGILEFTGIRTDRQLKINIYDHQGKELWNRTIPEKQKD